jgi:tetratricopeptide (TPR) repeat protein
MEKESTSFWADIKKFEDILAKDPQSYCFAPLSELYRKLGLLDDALSVAKRGAEIHPEYIGGQIALGRAYFEKGLNQQARLSLEKVAKATPENLLAQKLLFRIYKDEGDIPAAEKALNLLVAFNPEDLESREALAALRKSPDELEAAEAVATEETGAGLEVMCETEQQARESGQPQNIDVDVVLDGEDPVDAGLPLEPDFCSDEWLDDTEGGVAECSDEAVPMTTATLAELYVSQGCYAQALGVYEQLARQEPANADIAARASAVRELIQQSGAVLRQGAAPMADAGGAGAETGTVPAGMCRDEAALVQELEHWLNSIKGRKECR